MLLLVYHAPPYIRNLAADLLAAFRSTQILPQLVELVSDETLDLWLRIYALRAYSAAPTDRLAGEFEPIARRVLTERERQLQHLKKHATYLHSDLLGEFATLADRHPSNRGWFFALMETTHPLVVKNFLADRWMYHHSKAFHKLLAQRLLVLLDLHPHLLDLSVVNSLVRHDVIGQEWLEKRFDTVLAMCLANISDRKVKSIARFWPRMHDALGSFIQDWEAEIARFHNQTPKHDDTAVDYRQTPAYVFLNDLYDRANGGDKDAYQQLADIARWWHGNIPVRAVATHFIGKFGAVHDVFPILAYQMRYGSVDWDIYLFDSPIRYEAGEALLRFPIAATWEVMVDSFFVRPADDLIPFQIKWIAYVTDVLSGDDKPYKGSHYGSEEHRAWFRALSEVSAEELAAMQKLGTKRSAKEPPKTSG